MSTASTNTCNFSRSSYGERIFYGFGGLNTSELIFDFSSNAKGYRKEKLKISRLRLLRLIQCTGIKFMKKENNLWDLDGFYLA